MLIINENKEISKGDKKMVQTTPIGFVIVIAMAFILINAILVMPVTPKVTATFQIEPIDSYDAEIKLTNVKFEKITLSTYFLSKIEEVALTPLTDVENGYRLNITMYYLEETQDTKNFSNIGFGTYQTQIILSRITLEKEEPFVFKIAFINEEGRILDVTNATIYPT